MLHGGLVSGFLGSVFVLSAGCDLCCRGCSEGMRRGLPTRCWCAGRGWSGATWRRRQDLGHVWGDVWDGVSRMCLQLEQE